jgi:DNA gyrase subunit A
VLLASAQGMTIRFKEELARCTGRPSKGVIGMRLDEGDRLVGLVTLEPGDPEDKLLLVTENGYGKRTPLEEFPSQGRGGKGVLGIKVDEKTGLVVAIEKVKDDDEIMVATLNGKIIRISAQEVRIVGRYAKGVKLIDLDEGDKVVSVVRYVPGRELPLPRPLPDTGRYPYVSCLLGDAWGAAGAQRACRRIRAHGRARLAL